MRLACLLLLSLSLLQLSACSTKTKPILYPNSAFHENSKARVDQDTQRCLELGNDYVKQPEKYTEMAKASAIGGAVGAGSGAISGAILKGSVGRSTGAGAAVGAIVGLVHELLKGNKQSPSYERFVEHCLHKEGYEVTGWH